MKKLVYSVMVFIASRGMAQQITPQTSGFATGKFRTTSYYRMNRDTTQTYSQDIDSNIYGDLWLRDGTWDENATIADGDGAFQRGELDTSISLWINNILSGRLYEVSPQDAYTSGLPTYIYGYDDPEVSCVNGYSVDRSSSGQRSADNAVTLMHSDTDYARYVGSWTFDEGNYFGGAGYSGIAARQATAFSSYGASFVAGEQTEVASAASGAYLAELAGDVYIDNETDKETDRFQAGTFTSVGTLTGGGDYYETALYEGGDGLFVGDDDTDDGITQTMGITILGGDFTGSLSGDDLVRSIDYTDFDTYGATASARGGRGAYLGDAAEGVLIAGGNYIGGPGGQVVVGGQYSEAYSMGGEGAVVAVSGSTVISNAYFEAGRSYSATTVEVGLWDVETLEELEALASYSSANASGASGLYLYENGSTTISNITTIGSAGSVASAQGSNSTATANGGSGLLVYNTDVVIHGGTFAGAEGGAANADDTDSVASAYGGAGVWQIGSSLTINGGTFSGGEGGTANGDNQQGGFGVVAQDADLTITEESGDTLIVGDLLLNNSTTTSKSVQILGGEIEGDIYSVGSGTVNMNVSEEASYTGAFIQKDGTVNVTLTDSSESEFFSDVSVTDGILSFTGLQMITAESAQFSLGGTNSMLAFEAGAELSEGSSISVGYNALQSTGDLILGDDASVEIAYHPLEGLRGNVTIIGALVATNINSKIKATGTSDTPDGTLVIVAATAPTELGENDIHDIIDVDLGWLTRMDTNQTDTGAGVVIGYEYNSLTNSSLNDLGPAMLVYADSLVLGLTNDQFCSLNASGEEDGDKLFRFSLSQLPDVSESSFQLSKRLNEQIAARGTEFRSLNGFASSEPKFTRNQSAGVAGPVNELDSEQTMQGWVRAYGGKGSKDATDKFADYDSSSWGSVIGVDKSFGNLLIGLAGGYARTDLDAGVAYQADVDTYYGSLYSTVGGDSFFFDLAFTYGWASTDEENEVSAASFDSALFSAYAGAGYVFDLGDAVALTPEVSLLASYYDQEQYNREGILGTGTVKEYDSTSCQGAIGATLATQHQLEWLNRGIAYTPQVRAHYIHEFNADPENFTYVIGGTTSSFAVHPRDEHLLRLGFGFDLWSWKYQSTKFEVDYDTLISDTYFEQIVSGKITWDF
ncbi:autotransporter outer membrane beta-barrel domain-containing protein [Pontiellaceae bacterium B12227]|nr:autotransporter outer membrane beta-barrel domain-containing protein [Pontiellaceae bacterium B12227]